jgi:hypothetical protein
MTVSSLSMALPYKHVSRELSLDSCDNGLMVNIIIVGGIHMKIELQLVHTSLRLQNIIGIPYLFHRIIKTFS